MADSKSGRETYDSLVGLASDLVHADTVNEVLHGISVASRARERNQHDRTLDLSREGGKRVGYLFRPEAENVFRKRGIRPDVQAAFEETAYRERNPADLIYTRENDVAIVLFDNTPRYVFFGDSFVRFLVENLKYRPENIFTLAALSGKSIERAGQGIRNSGKKLGEVNRFANAVVYFTGVSYGDGSISVGNKDVPYSDWLPTFRSHEGNIVFIHDTSFAGKMEAELNNCGILPDRAMLLAACGPEEVGCGNYFSRDVMGAYGSGKAYIPKIIKVDTDPPKGIKVFLDLFGISEPEGGGKVVQTPIKKGADLDYLLLDYFAQSI